MLARDQDPQFINAVNALLNELRMRNAVNDYCPRCSTNDWNVDVLRVYAVPMPLANSWYPPPSASGAYFPESQAYIPTLCIVCKNCGNMILHNLQSLTKMNPLLLRSLGFRE